MARPGPKRPDDPQPPLRATLEDYLRLRRALGFKLNNAGRLLGLVVDYLEEARCRDDQHRRRPGLGVATRGGVQPLAGHPAGCCAPGFRRLPARNRRLCDSSTGRDHSKWPVPGHPYLYSAAEIASLLEATAELSPRLRSVTYYSLIGLLAVSGMRIGEAIALNDDDLDTPGCATC